MSDTETTVDPFVALLEQEFAEIDASTREFTDEERYIANYAKSLSRRDDEIARIQHFCLKESERLKREKDNIVKLHGPNVAKTLDRIKGNKKSINTPYGRVGMRSTKPTVTWSKEDEQQIIDWCKEHHPDAVSESVPKPRIGLLKTELTTAMEDGEDVPATTYVGEHETLYVKTETK